MGKGKRILRDRSESELDFQLEGLLEIYDIFNDINVKMFLSAGTMLGAVRQNDFILWDWNVSVCSLSNEFDKKFDIFIEKLKEKEFSLEIAKKGKNKEWIGIRAKKKGITYIIENLIIKGQWATRPYHKFPAKFLKSFEMIELRGRLFPCPSPAKKAVKWQYGKDWEKPIRAGHRNEVINPDHKIKG